jgi:hypothetical protein
MWIFGMRTYDFLADGRHSCAQWSTELCTPSVCWTSKRASPETARPSIHGVHATYVRAHGNRFATVAASPTEAAAIVVVDVTTGSYGESRAHLRLRAGPASISVGRPIEFAAPGGPHRPRVLLPAGERRLPKGHPDELPPLWTLIHGGPTSQAKLAFSLSIQF